MSQKSPTDPFPIVSPRWAVPWSVFPRMPALILALLKGVKIDFRAPTCSDHRFKNIFLRGSLTSPECRPDKSPAVRFQST
jgi:hypothetical protein